MKNDELGKTYSDGEIICREGEIGEVMYIIQSGKVKVTKKDSSGEDMVIATLKSGEIFGEMALFDRSPRSATVTAFDEARVLSIDKKKLFSSINRDPTLMFKLLESMSQRIRRLDEEFMKLKKKKSDILHLYCNLEDTCKFILEEARNAVMADNGSIMLLDDKEKTLFIKSAFGTESKTKIKLGIGEGIAGDALKTGKAELVNNVTMDPRFRAGTANIKSLLCIPLRYGTNRLGVINMSNNAERLFTIDDLKLLSSLSIYASIAVQNAKDFSKLQSATDEILVNASMMLGT